jgi:hypothetical protein
LDDPTDYYGTTEYAWNDASSGPAPKPKMLKKFPQDGFFLPCVRDFILANDPTGPIVQQAARQLFRT